MATDRENGQFFICAYQLRVSIIDVNAWVIAFYARIADNPASNLGVIYFVKEFLVTLQSGCSETAVEVFVVYYV